MQVRFWEEENVVLSEATERTTQREEYLLYLFCPSQRWFMDSTCREMGWVSLPQVFPGKSSSEMLAYRCIPSVDVSTKEKETFRSPQNSSMSIIDHFFFFALDRHFLEKSKTWSDKILYYVCSFIHIYVYVCMCVCTCTRVHFSLYAWGKKCREENLSLNILRINCSLCLWQTVK